MTIYTNTQGYPGYVPRVPLGTPGYSEGLPRRVLGGALLGGEVIHSIDTNVRTGIIYTSPRRKP